MESPVEALSNGNNCDGVDENSEIAEKCCKTHSDDDITSDKAQQIQVATESEVATSDQVEKVELNVVYNKQSFVVSVPVDDTVQSMKTEIERLTGVPVTNQKLMYRGRMKDDQTLRDHKVTKGAKIMVVGSTVQDILSISGPSSKAQTDSGSVVAAAKQPLCEQKPHKTILDKHGKPDDIMPGRRNKKESLPVVPLSGMYNKSGGKVRLTFKLEQDQLWIGTRERTEKVPMNSIRTVVSEAIVGHEDYHIMGIQLGTTEASRYWIYWVPAQYIESIKDTILGKWQCF